MIESTYENDALLDDVFKNDFDDELCSICGQRKEWIDCWQCGGEGFYDETEIDPFEGDEFAVCPECHGVGGWRECLNVPLITEAA